MVATVRLQAPLLEHFPRREEPQQGPWGPGHAVLQVRVGRRHGSTQASTPKALQKHISASELAETGHKGGRGAE